MIQENIEVLIIEDDLEDVELLQDMIHQIPNYRYHLTVSQSLREGLALLRDHTYSVILLDLGLPDSHGLDSFHHVHEQVPGVPIVVLTGLSDEDMARKLVKLGAQDYLMKGQIGSQILMRSINYSIERKKTEDTLRSSEELLDTFLNSSTEGFGIMNENLTIVRLNKAAAGIYGKTPEDFIGKTVMEISPDFKSSGRYDEYKRILETGEPLDMEGIVPHPTLGNLHYLQRVFRVGEGIGVITTNITDRVRSEKRIKHLNRMKERLLGRGSLIEKLERVTEDVVRIFDTDFARIWISKPGDRCDTGCFHAKMKDGPHVCRFKDRCLYLMASSGRYTHTDGKVHTRVPFDCYKIGKIASGKATKFVTNDVAHDERIHDRDWARKHGLQSFAGYQILSEAGKTIGVLALFSKHLITSEEDGLLESIANTTAQVIQNARFNEQLKERNRMINALINSPKGIVIFSVDKDYRYLVFNENHRDEIKKIYGVDIEHGMCILDIISARIRDRAKKSFDRSLQGESFTEVVEQRRTDSYFDFQCSPIFMENGEVIGVTVVVTDITKRMRSRKEMVRLNDELGKKNKEFADLLYITSHDLRSPLVNIQGFSEEIGESFTDIKTRVSNESISDETRVAMDQVLGQDIPEALQFIQSSVYKMETLINGLLHISRLGTSDIAIIDLDMDEMLVEISNTIQYRLRDQDIDLKIHPLPPCRGDEQQINQVLSNLLDNAIKYQDPEKKGTIDVSGIQNDNQVIYQVKDNGIGIPELHLENIFKIFHRIDHSTTTGEGLGLTAVKRILERHDGRIWVESKEGNGTTFFFSLPAAGGGS